MQTLRQLGGGVIVALVSVILVIGGISLAIAESAAPPETPAPITPTVQVFLPSLTPPFTTTPSETTTPIATAIPSLTLPSQSATSIPPAQCIPPTGWFQMVVGFNDTIYTLAQRYNTSADALKNANCLPSFELQAGRTLYVPPVPTVTLIPCGPPAGWVRNHVVQPGDNLFRIALSYGLSYPQLQGANCMGSSTTIYAGQLLWVPNRPTRTPIPGATIIPTIPTSTASFTSMPPTLTLPPTLTSTFISTSSPVPTATPSSTSPAVQTQTPSLTPFP